MLTWVTRGGEGQVTAWQIGAASDQISGTKLSIVALAVGLGLYSTLLMGCVWLIVAIVVLLFVPI